MLLTLLRGDVAAVITPGLAVTRYSGLGFSILELDEADIVATLVTTLPTLTAALAGTRTLQYSGTVQSTLPTLTAAASGTTIRNALGTVSSTLPTLTAALAGSTAGAAVTGTIGGEEITFVDDTGADIVDDTGALLLAVPRSGYLPELTAALSGAETMTGTVASTLPTLTAAMIGTHTVAGAVGGAMMSTLPTVTAALAGAMTTSGSIASTLPTLTAALAGLFAVPVTGTLASTLPTLTARLSGLQIAAGRGDDYPWQVYKKAAEREKKARDRTAALRKQIRQKLGLDPPDPEPVDDSPPQAAPLGPFFLQPDLGVLGLQSQLGIAEGDLAQATKALRQADDEVAVNAILSADDAAPQVQPFQVSGVPETPGMPMDLSPEPTEGEKTRATVGQAVEPLKKGQDAMRQGMDEIGSRVALQGQALEQGQQTASEAMAQAMQQIMASHQQLLEQVNRPRKKTLTVKRNAKGAITGADVLEEA